MMNILDDNFMVCVDCLPVIANGDYTHLDPSNHGSVEEAFARVREIDEGMALASGSIYVGDADRDEEFCTSSCECCGSGLAGSRHHCIILERDDDAPSLLGLALEWSAHTDHTPTTIEDDRLTADESYHCSTLRRVADAQIVFLRAATKSVRHKIHELTIALQRTHSLVDEDLIEVCSSNIPIDVLTDHAEQVRGHAPINEDYIKLTFVRGDDDALSERFEHACMDDIFLQEARFQGGSWDHPDVSLRRETYNNWVDMMQKDGEALECEGQRGIPDRLEGLTPDDVWNDGGDHFFGQAGFDVRLLAEYEAE